MHLQKHLLRLHLGQREQVDHPPLGGEGGRDRGGSRDHVLARHGAAHDDGILGRLHLDVVARRDLPEALGQERHVALHDDVEEERLVGIENDERRDPPHLTVQENLVWRDGEDVRDGRVCHGQPGEGLLQIDDLRLADRDVEPDEALLGGPRRRDGRCDTDNNQ